MWHHSPYWLTTPLILGQSPEKLSSQREGILVIGTGFTGVSVAHWLQEAGWPSITLVDFEPETSASFRNCGHILYGTVESMAAMVALHGPEKAKRLWGFSAEVCEEMGRTIETLRLNCEYRRNGYLVIAFEEKEIEEIHESIHLLHSMDFESRFVERKALEGMGFQNILGARFDPRCASAHPVKFRNGLLQHVLINGASYYSGVQVQNVEEGGSQGVVVSTTQGEYIFGAVVLAGNAYCPLISETYKGKQLIEPFRGQILTSKPLKHPPPIPCPHSFDHGYEYALFTEDKRLMLGGWRNHTPGGEVGTYDITPNPLVEEGLQAFAKEYYRLSETLEWEFSWAGIMAASSRGVPLIGPLSPRVFTCSGYTGHGFSWAHGSAKLLAQMIMGEDYPKDLAQMFNPLAF